MEQYRSANSISLHDHASFAQRNVTQIPQNTARVLDKVRARPIISFVRSRNLCSKHKIRKTIKQSRSHEPAAKKGFLEAFAGGCRALLVQNSFRSGTSQTIAGIPAGHAIFSTCSHNTHRTGVLSSCVFFVHKTV